eukprot:3021394-Prymnesium_polylepis.2
MGVAAEAGGLGPPDAVAVGASAPLAPMVSPAACECCLRCLKPTRGQEGDAGALACKIEWSAHHCEDGAYKCVRRRG